MDLFTSAEFWEISIAVATGVLFGKIAYALLDGFIAGLVNK